ncbi:MAG: DUF3267 domain-containing protein [Chloroflexi bacterium]|nr:DUF3267 domain-containing protein [Chloroflexota bacterium]
MASPTAHRVAPRVSLSPLHSVSRGADGLGSGESSARRRWRASRTRVSTLATSLPEGYARIGRWDLGRVPRWRIVVLLLLSLASMVAAASVGSAILSLKSGAASINLDALDLLLGLVLALVLHELTHGVAFLALGARPQFGVKLRTKFGPVFYASAPGSYLTKSGYLVAGLAPALGLTVLLLAIMALAPAGGVAADASYLAAILNFGGSAGDAMMMRTVLSYPADARFEDTGDGFTVYGPTRV